MKPSRHLKRLLKNESAQALVETVIVLPVVIFFILGTIQLTLMHQARLMLEYAAFNAARTGSVWNADPVKMHRAALISLIPSQPTWPAIGGLGAIQSTGELMAKAALLVVFDDIVKGAFPVVTVDTLSPTQDDFEEGQLELDFDVAGDSFETRRKGQLTIRVTYFYNLFVPFVNKIVWATWYGARASYVGLAGQILDYFEVDGHQGRAASPFLAFKYPGLGSLEGEGLAAFIRLLAGADFSDPYECLKFEDWIRVVGYSRGLLGITGDTYPLPLITTHTIRMQSNHYKSNLPTKEEASCQDYY